MSERIDTIAYQAPAKPSTVEGKETVLFLTGPAEFLCDRVAKQLAGVDVWKRLFGDSIDPYKRMDYSMRALPALRIYNDGFVKDFESWYITGFLTLDIIWPPALRRGDLQQIPDTVAAAILQQFRRPEHFAELCELVPSLNELGKRVQCDKSLGFELSEEEVAPLTQILLNFRMDLRAWDEYLESDNRTKDEPFSRPLGDLKQIVSLIEALRDDGETELTLGIDQPTTP